jgi:hypothetical protein
VIVAGVLGDAVLDAVALICSPGDGCGKIHQRSRAGAAALIVIVAGAVLDPVASSTSSTSEGGPALSSWS